MHRRVGRGGFGRLPDRKAVRPLICLDHLPGWLMSWSWLLFYGCKQLLKRCFETSFIVFGNIGVLEGQNVIGGFCQRNFGEYILACQPCPGVAISRMDVDGLLVDALQLRS